MDVSILNTAIGAEKGAFLHLRHPATGKPLNEGDKAVGVWVRGADSKSVVEDLKETQKARAKGIEDESGMAFVASMVIRFEGLDRDGKPLGNDRDSVLWFLGQSGSFIEQILAFAQDRANFFGASATA